MRGKNLNVQKIPLICMYNVHHVEKYCDKCLRFLFSLVLLSSGLAFPGQ